MNKQVWEQAIRLASALENANRAGNISDAKIHHKALINILKQIIKMEDKS